MPAMNRKPTTLEEQLRQAIIASGMSQRKLGLACGVHQTQLSRFLRAERNLSLEAAGKVCAYLGLVLTPTTKQGRRV